jgi:hypothetical protein
VDGDWVPLAGRDDIYLHFFIDLTEYAADRLFPQGAGAQDAACRSCTAA